MTTHVIVIEDERPPSWNQLYSGNMHWSKRTNMAREKHLLVRANLNIEWDMFVGPVEIEVIVYFENRPQDADNIPAKVYIDGLKGWLIQDDTSKFVSRVVTESRVDKLRPRVEIYVSSVVPL